MLSAPVLYVGGDLCRRIPVIERYGARSTSYKAMAFQTAQSWSFQQIVRIVSCYEPFMRGILPPVDIAIAECYIGYCVFR